MSLFYEHVGDTINLEGGYVNNPHDSGGATNFGITEEVARSWGYDGNMKNLSKSIAIKIYKNLYWTPLKLDNIAQISEKIAVEMFDTGVNAGIKTSARFLQRGLNLLNRRGTLYKDIKVDGIIGSITISVLETLKEKRRQQGLDALFVILDTLQGYKYINLAETREKDEEFIMGWVTNRLR